MKMKNDNRKYDLEERLLNYTINIIKVVEALPNTRTGNHIANQLLRSGTSPYPNHGEAQAAESNNDFIHKMRICLKELRETYSWLKVIKRLKLISYIDKPGNVFVETEELIKIFVTSIKTAGRRKKQFDVES
jgi:four helix bundle protein